MTIHDLPAAGAAGAELAARVHEWWTAAAARCGIDLAGFVPTAAFAERAAWAAGRSLSLAAILSRFSTKMQHSTEAQVRECVEWAARNGLYPPPELVCVDEAVTGKKADRDGLNRMKKLLAGKRAAVLLVYKISRLFRVAHLGYQFFQEHLVEEGLRGVAVSQSIDTADERVWKPMAYLHGIIDELVLTAIADHVRTGLRDLFADGYVTGPLTVGYFPVEVAGAPTNRGRPRTMPQVDTRTAEMIREHYALVRDGMPIKAGWRRWVRAGGPRDPRSSLPNMSYAAYRRMLSNPRYTGAWAFGRKRNVWSTKKDANRQIAGPEAEVAVRRCEELRIVDDVLFAAVQARLAELAVGPRGPKRRKDIRLWDLVTECFWCPRCDVRFYQAGANGAGMRCKRGDLCPALSAVRREPAVKAVCATLDRLLAADPGLVDRVVARGQEIDAAGDGEGARQLAELERREGALRNRITDLTELAGDGDEAERAALKTRVRAARTELAEVRARLTAARGTCAATPLSAAELRAALDDLTALLGGAAAGELGADATYRAAAAFRQMVGRRVYVHVETRANKKRTTARGVFRPDVFGPVLPGVGAQPEQVEVWLRPPPRIDLLAERVHRLIDGEGQSYRDAAGILRAEGFDVNSGNVWYAYRRYYAMRGEPIPDRPYNNGRPRRPAG